MKRPFLAAAVAVAAGAPRIAWAILRARFARLRATLLLGLALAAAVPFGAALAVDFDKTVTQMDGTPFPDGKPEDAKLRKIVVNTLLAVYPDETNLPGDQKLARFSLAQKVQRSKGDVKLTSEETSLLKAMALKGLPALLAGQVVEAIDPASLAAPALAPSTASGPAKK